MALTTQQILNIITDLAGSQGFWGRLLQDLYETKENDPEQWALITKEWDEEGFENTLDVVLYFEEGKHCKKKYWKIPVTFEAYGTVSCPGKTKEDALAYFKEHEKELPLPTDWDYVDGSFQLSNDNEEELKEMMEEE